MNKNVLQIVIKKPVDEVFSFTTKPENTAIWITSVTEEKIDAHPIKVGTVYKNTSDGISWDEYICTKYEEGKVFELKNMHTPYMVEYTYESHGKKITKLTYSEWMSDGSDLSSVFEMKTLERLKMILEKKI